MQLLLFSILCMLYKRVCNMSSKTLYDKKVRFVQIEGEVLQSRHVKLCKLGGRDLALITIKLLQEKGAKEVTDVHVEVFVRIVKKYCSG